MRFEKEPSGGRLTYIFDLDGVLYRGSEPQPHAREAIASLRNRGHLVRFFTNNAARSRSSYAATLASMGIQASVEEIMTSSYATGLYFVEQGATGRTVYCIGEQGMSEELQAVGMKCLRGEERPDAHIDFVVVGMDRGFNYATLVRAQQAILSGARFIATNEDPTYPVEGGGILPGGGCMVAAIRTATAVEPFVVGKPQTYAFNKILELAATPPERAIMIGDRLETDILVGNRAGAQTVLVLTGVTSREQAEAAGGDLRPGRIIETLVELL